MMLTAMAAIAVAPALPAMAPASANDVANIFTTNTTGWIERSRLMMENRNYAGVADQLSQLAVDNPGEQNNILLSPSERTECAYMFAMACFELDDKECLSLLREFILNHPASPLSIQASLAYADYFFYKGDFQAALREYDKINIPGLERRQRNLYSYRRALALIRCGRADEARPLLAPIANDKEYANAALFYDAYIDYINGDYDTAYPKFMRVNPDPDDTPETSSISRRRRPANINTGYKSQGLEAGYYIAQIEYTRGEYDNVIKHGRALLERRPVLELAPEIERIVGLSYFKKGMPSVAESFLKTYHKLAGDNTADDALYALGAIAYDNGDYDRARQLLQPLTDNNDALAQGASLYLGQIAADSGDNNAAALNFQRAARLNYDNSVAETARYNLIVANMHGANAPFSSDVETLETFLRDYPRSQYADAVRESLAQAYFNDQDYRRALQSIDRIPDQTPRLAAARQKILYELGSELVSNGRYGEAIPYLRQATQGADTALAAQCQLWLGDALYATGDYRQARDAYRRAHTSLPSGDNKTLALYNLAYASYMADDFSAAATLFRQALEANPALPSSLQADALMRRADCLYYTGKYKEADALYARARHNNTKNSDYAAYRQALIAGLSDNDAAKITALQNFVASYPDSQWAPDAMLETGLTLIATGKDAKAIPVFQKLIEKYPSQPQTRKAMLNMAYAYSKTGQGDKAEQTFRRLISTWPSSEEATAANEDLRRLYAASDRLDEYVSFLASIPGAPALNADTRQQLTFDAATEALTDNPSDTALMETYIERYPDGIYIASALLQLAKADINNGKYDSALRRLQTLSELRPDSPEAGEALMLMARLLEEKYPGRRSDALRTWRALENKATRSQLGKVYAGIMRTTDNDADRLKYAALTLSSGSADADDIDDATYYQALARLKGNNAKDALATLARLADNPKSLAGSKSAVALGQYYIDHRQYDKAIDILTRFTDAGTPHAYWLARGFIALSDAYKGKGDTALAIDYLQSLQDNYPVSGDDIPQLIQQRLKKWKK